MSLPPIPARAACHSGEPLSYVPINIAEPKDSTRASISFIRLKIHQTPDTYERGVEGRCEGENEEKPLPNP